MTPGILTSKFHIPENLCVLSKIRAASTLHLSLDSKFVQSYKTGSSPTRCETLTALDGCLTRVCRNQQVPCYFHLLLSDCRPDRPVVNISLSCRLQCAKSHLKERAWSHRELLALPCYRYRTSSTVSYESFLNYQVWGPNSTTLKYCILVIFTTTYFGQLVQSSSGGL